MFRIRRSRVRPDRRGRFDAPRQRHAVKPHDPGVSLSQALAIPVRLPRSALEVVARVVVEGRRIRTVAEAGVRANLRAARQRNVQQARRQHERENPPLPLDQRTLTVHNRDSAIVATGVCSSQIIGGDDATPAYSPGPCLCPARAALLRRGLYRPERSHRTRQHEAGRRRQPTMTCP